MNHQNSDSIIHENSCYWQNSFSPLFSSPLSKNIETDIVAEPENITNAFDAIGTEGLHLHGNIYWNNDEESWDKIHKKQEIRK